MGLDFGIGETASHLILGLQRDPGLSFQQLHVLHYEQLLF